MEMTRRRERLQTEDLLDARDAISLLSREYPDSFVKARGFARHPWRIGMVE